MSSSRGCMVHGHTGRVTYSIECSNMTHVGHMRPTQGGMYATAELVVGSCSTPSCLVNFCKLSNEIGALIMLHPKT